MITRENIKPIPKYMLKIIQRFDSKLHKYPNAQRRFYAYLTVWKKELIKITVAVRHKYKRWQCKQVAIHSLRLSG